MPKKKAAKKTKAAAPGLESESSALMQASKASPLLLHSALTDFNVLIFFVFFFLRQRMGENVVISL